VRHSLSIVLALITFTLLGLHLGAPLRLKGGSSLDPSGQDSDAGSAIDPSGQRPKSGSVIDPNGQNPPPPPPPGSGG